MKNGNHSEISCTKYRNFHHHRLKHHRKKKFPDSLCQTRDQKASWHALAIGSTQTDLLPSGNGNISFHGPMHERNMILHGCFWVRGWNGTPPGQEGSLYSSAQLCARCTSGLPFTNKVLCWTTIPAITYQQVHKTWEGHPRFIYYQINLDMLLLMFSITRILKLQQLCRNLEQCAACLHT